MYSHLAQPHHPYREAFRSCFEQYAERNGQAFTVLGEISSPANDPNGEVDPECYPMYVIRFPDGHETHAWPEEIRLDYYVPGEPGYKAMMAAGDAA